MPETLGTPPEGKEMVADDVQEEMDKAVRELDRKILEKVASDPSFKDKLLSDPGAALEEAGLADEAAALEGAGDVAGHHYRGAYSYIYRRCIVYTNYYRYHSHC